MTTSIPHFRGKPARAFLLLAFGLACLTTVLASLATTSSSSANPLRSIAKRQVGVPGTTQQVPLYKCVVVGECLPCTPFYQKTEDTCKETHNRQKVECKYDDPKDNEDEELKILLPTHRVCFHVKAVEARRFAHFLSTNIFLAFFSGVLMVWRKRKLAAAQYRRMARRIGIA